MIAIEIYGNMMQDLMARANSILPAGNKIDKLILSPKEEHLIKHLRDETGVNLCASYPNVDTEGIADAYHDMNSVFLFILQKMNFGSMNDQQERAFFQKMQLIANTLKRLLLEHEYSCDIAPVNGGKMKIEWEYNIYGGFSGLSIGLTLRDND